MLAALRTSGRMPLRITELRERMVGSNGADN